MKKLLVTCLSLFIVFIAFAQEKPEGLFINSKAPDFKGVDQNGKEVSFKDMRKKGNVVVIFYRGNWCPYCNRELKRFQDSLEFIVARGAQVIAIGPEAQAGIDSTVAKTGATFPILFDKDMKISKGYKVSYKVDDRTVGRYKNAGIDLLETNKQVKDVYLPVPAVYIVNTDGAVIYRYFEEDYKKLVSVKEILLELN